MRIRNQVLDSISTCYQNIAEANIAVTTLLKSARRVNDEKDQLLFKSQQGKAVQTRISDIQNVVNTYISNLKLNGTQDSSLLPNQINKLLTGE